MNANKLKSLMTLNGDTQDSLAAALNISRVTLNLKLNEKDGRSFNLEEITAIKRRYSLSPDDIDSIFFSRDVS